jgi:hypothetical protein
MVTNDPLIRETSTPPIIAVMIPADGGKPEAIEIPRDNGKAIRKTRKPDNRSLDQFSFRPAMPVFGIANRVDSLIQILVIVKRLKLDMKRLSCQPYIFITP